MTLVRLPGGGADPRRRSPRRPPGVPRAAPDSAPRAGILRGVAEEDADAKFLRGVLEAAHDLGIEGVGDIGDDEPYGPCPLEPERARDARRLVIEGPIALSTRARVDGSTRGDPARTRVTVPRDTAASSATSMMVGLVDAIFTIPRRSGRGSGRSLQSATRAHHRPRRTRAHSRCGADSRQRRTARRRRLRGPADRRRTG